MNGRKLETYERGKQDSDELESYQDPPREKVSKRTGRNYISIGNSKKRVHFYCSVYVCVHYGRVCTPYHACGRHGQLCGAAFFHTSVDFKD